LLLHKQVFSSIVQKP